METLCCACKQNTIPSLYVQLKSQTKRLICDNHSVSSIPVNLQYLQNSIRKLEIAINQITSNILSVIQNFKLKVFSSYRIYERVLYQLADYDISNNDKLIFLDKVQFTMGTFEMKRLLENPYYIFTNVSIQINDIFQQYIKRLSNLNNNNNHANQPNIIQTKASMTPNGFSKKQEELLSQSVKT